MVEGLLHRNRFFHPNLTFFVLFVNFCSNPRFPFVAIRPGFTFRVIRAFRGFNPPLSPARFVHFRAFLWLTLPAFFRVFRGKFQSSLFAHRSGGGFWFNRLVGGTTLTGRGGRSALVMVWRGV